MDELEELRQENHRLNLRLESLRTTSTTEIDYLKDELKEKEREHSEQLEKIVGDAKTREATLLERIETINEDLNLSRDETDKLKDNVEALKLSLEHQKLRNNEAMNRKSNHPISVDHYEALQESLSEKEKALSRANETISSQSDRLREYNDANESQRNKIAELNEDIETKQLTILEQQERIRELEMEKNEQIHQNQQQTLEKCDTAKSRGNSLFSEVEERRVKVEDELKRLRDRVAKLTAENVDLQATVERGDSRNNAVNHQLQLLQKSEEQVIKEFKQLKSERLNVFEQLTERIDAIRNEYLKRLSKYDQGHSIMTTDIEKLSEERDKLMVGKINLERVLFDCKKELKFIKHTKTECESHLKILRIKMQDQNERRASSRSPRKKKDSNHVDDKTEDATADHSNDSMDIENNLSGGVEEDSKKSAEEIAECKQQ